MKTQCTKAIIISTALSAGVIFSGCSSPLPKYQIAIDSDPEGMRVEVNNEYIGVTPTVYSIAGNSDRSFNGSWVQQPGIEFVATPPHDQPNLYVQTKAFSPSAFFKQGDHIPEKIFFDMHDKTSSTEHLQIDTK